MREGSRGVRSTKRDDHPRCASEWNRLRQVVAEASVFSNGSGTASGVRKFSAAHRGYNGDDAVVIASHEPGEPMEFVTPFALTQPGAKAAFKIFVVLTTGNEAGSAEMVVERPVEVSIAA